jgi:hypothetical protein
VNVRVEAELDYVPYDALTDLADALAATPGTDDHSWQTGNGTVVAFTVRQALSVADALRHALSRIEHVVRSADVRSEVRAVSARSTGL